MSMFSGKCFVWALIAACLLGVGSTRAAVPIHTPRNSPEALRDFGVEKSEPIESGFLFYAGKYVDMPYVVERRGLDIFINGHCVQPGPEYPPFEYDVSEDPGDPPPGSSPFDPPPEGTDRRDTYWARKSAYLSAHYDDSAFVKKMIETYLKSTEVVSVEPLPGFSRSYVVTLKDGRTVNIGFMRGKGTVPQDKESFLRGARQAMSYVEIGLRAGSVSFVERGGEVGIPSSRSLSVLEALLSSEDPEVRLENVLKLGIAPGKSDKAFWGVIAGEFEPSEQLSARYEAMKAAEAEAQSKKAIKRSIREMEGALDLGKTPIVTDLRAKEGIAETEAKSPPEPGKGLVEGVSPSAPAEQDGGRGRMIVVAVVILALCVVVAIGLQRRNRAARTKG